MGRLLDKGSTTIGDVSEMHHRSNLHNIINVMKRRGSRVLFLTTTKGERQAEFEIAIVLHNRRAPLSALCFSYQ